MMILIIIFIMNTKKMTMIITVVGDKVIFKQFYLKEIYMFLLSSLKHKVHFSFLYFDFIDLWFVAVI